MWCRRWRRKRLPVHFRASADDADDCDSRAAVVSQLTWRPRTVRVVVSWLRAETIGDVDDNGDQQEAEGRWQAGDSLGPVLLPQVVEVRTSGVETNAQHEVHVDVLFAQQTAVLAEVRGADVDDIQCPVTVEQLEASSVAVQHSEVGQHPGHGHGVVWNRWILRGVIAVERGIHAESPDFHVVQDATSRRPQARAD